MKKTLMIATAITMIAAPALAQTVGAGTTYSDNVSTFQINAPVSNFCKFGNVNNVANANTGTVGNDSYGNGAATGDQAFVVDIQKDSDNTVQAASGSFNYAQAQCNTPYSVTTASQNAGLLSSYTGAADAAFIKKIPYSIAFAAGTTSSGNQPIASTNTLLASGTPFASSARFFFTIPASGSLLLAGTYRDEVRLTMSPLTGGPSI